MGTSELTSLCNKR